ncbi:hypothetical protein M9H77_12889 [Catharanthus roseus]|uniref:Uncharacterized protein n=1 Tax=Catharanthus roseus TaxID=4058 RepID=A0ACC0BIS5_CATRO|nr:hypothetical protein M9H77_12889 [Catharanthus roseus]
MGCSRVKKFHREHNHVLANPRVVDFLRSHRNVSTSGITEAQSMCVVGIGIPQIIEYQSHQYGGYSHFFVGVHSTQRSESLNAFACTYLKSQLLLYPFVNKFEMVKSKFRQKELEEEYFTSFSYPLERVRSSYDDIKLYTITQYLHEGRLWKV